ncbi:glycosyltransferase family 90 protein [Myriangium duriaei CBS 260.36]|uniref:Glycosyltransferase family 90 protein n=1 Tax=Myriangium duriaei CBS 260.36 TaxID=1168546 RepID=A0A9P4MLE8_9PEZI|nr:glycosyltransferase family 90 protein [Myriangium duriaei CBS 260.36]
MLSVTGSPKALRLIQTAAAVFALIWLIRHYLFSHPDGRHALIGRPSIHDQPRAPHPIDELHKQGKAQFSALIAKQAFSVESAERDYLKRRGRRPPPGFDTWFRYAQDHDAVIVEDFFDRIYDDLNPFWALPAAEIRQLASDWKFRISIRNGNATQRTDIVRPWMDLWLDMVQKIAPLLPDLDLAMNEMDESRLVVPWETIDKHMKKEASTRQVIPKNQLMFAYSHTVIPDEEAVPKTEFGFEGSYPYWSLYVRGCHPQSPSRSGFHPEVDFTHPPPLPRNQPDYSFKGFVQNWTSTVSPCEHPELQGLHGSFVEPVSVSTTAKFFPMFGGSKLPANNDILIPAAMYWTEDTLYSGGESHGGDWSRKKTKVVWRGTATGGRNTKDNWTRFQRHRFVAMVNGTSVARAEWHQSPPPNFVIPNHDAYKLSFDQDYPLSQWLDEVADVGFTHLVCHPNPDPPFCAHTDPWYFVEPSLPMSKQYDAKYLPDIDGNSFSGRYRGFLGSTSLPIKATVYVEWHDTRLIPWAHFVPMDNTFVDVYAILEYFIGTKNRPGHDDVAETIASEGKSWAEKVLRKEDMVIYLFRLLLEYARLCDDNRDRLGWAS